PCKFSDRQLQNAQRETPPDVEQYAPSFLDALQYAREHSSGCHKKAAAPAPAPAAPTPSTPTPVPAPTTPAAPPAQTTPATPPAPTPPAQPTVAGVPSPPIHNAAHKTSAPTPVWLL